MPHLLTSLALALTASSPTDSSSTAVSQVLPNSSALHLYGGVQVGTPAGLELSLNLNEHLFWSLAGGWQNGDRGQWLGTTDLHYLFPNAIGSVGTWGHLILYAGLGGQLQSQLTVRYGGRVVAGIKLRFHQGEYEAFTQIASGLFFKPQIRSSLDGVFGLRLLLW